MHVIQPEDFNKAILEQFIEIIPSWCSFSGINSFLEQPEHNDMIKMIEFKNFIKRYFSQRRVGRRIRKRN